MRLPAKWVPVVRWVGEIAVYTALVSALVLGLAGVLILWSAAR